MNQFTVLMSVYEKDDANYFIEAVHSNFQQSVKPKELILVVDGFIPRQLETAVSTVKNQYQGQIKVIRLEKNSGLGLALREGMKHIQTNLVARADSDDISDKNRFEKQLLEFSREPDLVIVGGLAKEFVGGVSNITSSRRLPKNDIEIRKFSKFRSPFNHPTVMFKKDEILKAGNYQSFKSFEDYHLWMRVLNLGGRVKNIDDAVVFMRTDTGMYSRRGGVTYALQNLKLRWFFMKIGSISLFDMLLVDTILMITALIPTSFRSVLYKIFLRKR